MSSRSEVVEAFPQLDEISDSDLRERVIEIWVNSLEESDFNSLDEFPWAPHYVDIIGEHRQVPHIQDVVEYSIAIADTLTAQRDVSINRDYVVAGALVHDVSKFYEYSEDSEDGHSDIWDLIKHPHYGVHVAAEAGLPVELQHIVISHTTSSSVPPKTPEAVIVAIADEMASESIFMESTGLVRTLAEGS